MGDSNHAVLVSACELAAHVCGVTGLILDATGDIGDGLRAASLLNAERVCRRALSQQLRGEDYER